MAVAAGPVLGRDVIESVTQSATKPVTPHYFGTHVHRLQGTPVGEPGVTTWPSVRVGQLRLWDSGVAWMDIDPAPGRWDFRRLDTYIEAAEANQATVLYTLGLTPAWAPARPAERCSYGMGCAAEPRDMVAWADYVRSLALRYGNRIAAYELWNEPNFWDLARDRGQPGFYTGSEAQLVEMARVARQTLDQVSPSAQLCTPGFVDGPDRLEMFLAQSLEGSTVGPCRSLPRFGVPIVACQSRRDRNRHDWLWVDGAATSVLPISSLLAALGLPAGQGIRAIEPLFGNREPVIAAWRRGELPLGRVPVRLTLARAR